MSSKPKVLCVDDEPELLAGLRLTMRREFDFYSATGGAEGLKVLAEHGPFPVVVSDMRMPKMNGAEFLGKVRSQYPTTIRILLTGQSALEDAIAAVNEGQLFRFLTKPCTSQSLKDAVADGVRQYELQSAERELLQDTLKGTLSLVSDMLELAAPDHFGRSSRAQKHVAAIAKAGGLDDSWVLETAALLSRIGAPLAKGDESPEYHVAARLLKQVPRLGHVATLVESLDPKAMLGADAPPPWQSQLLRFVNRVVDLEDDGISADIAVVKTQNTVDIPDKLLPLIVRAIGGDSNSTVAQVKARELSAGMVFLDDVLLSTGVVFVRKGYQVSGPFLERIRNFEPGYLQEPFKVRIPGLDAAA